MVQTEQRSGSTHFVAGGIAGSAAVLLLHPFDVVKTRLQVQDGATAAQYRGTRHAFATILRREGVRGLYAGLSPSLLGSGVSWGAYLYLYERVKAWHREWQGAERLGPGWNLLSAAQAGAMVCLLTNPIWLIKTRLALQQSGAAAWAPAAGGAAAAAATAAAGRPYAGMFNALVRIGREEGIRGYYKGLGPSLVLQTTHGAIQFAAYEELKTWAAQAPWGTLGGRGGPAHAAAAPTGERPLTSLEVSMCGALSKLAAAISTYPTQVVRARLQQRFDTGRTLVYNTTWQAVRVTWVREGLAGFYKGLLPSLLRVMPQSAITLTVYERLLVLLAPLEAPPRDVPAAAGPRADTQQQQQQQEEEQQPPRVPPLTDAMRPLVVVVDSQAEN